MADLLTGQLADAKKAVTDGEAKIAATDRPKRRPRPAKRRRQSCAEKIEVAKKATAGQRSGRQAAGHGDAAGQAGPGRRRPVPAGAGKGSANNADLKQLAEAAKKLADDTEQRRKAAEAASRSRWPPSPRHNRKSTAAEAASMAAARLAAAAQTAHAKASEALPALQAATKSTEARLADATAKATAATQAATALENPFRTVAYSPDGSQLAVGGDAKPFIRSVPAPAGHRIV